MADHDLEIKMEKPPRRRLSTNSAMLMTVELLMMTAFVLSVLTMVAGRYPHTLQRSPFLTFDTSSVKTHLADQGIANAGRVQDWYEPHYLSVCKGSWLPGGIHVKNASSTNCTAMGAGYKFSLPQLLAADAGIPTDSPLLSTWSFAVFSTEYAYVCLTVAMSFMNWTWINYLFCMIIHPHLTPRTPLHCHRVGYLANVVALVTMLMSSSKITNSIIKVLDARPAAANGLVWSSHGFFVLTWLATSLLCLSLIISIILAFRLREPTSNQLRRS